MRKKHDRTRRVSPADYYALAHDEWDGVQRKDSAAKLKLSTVTLRKMLKQQEYKDIEAEVFAARRQQALQAPHAA